MPSTPPDPPGDINLDARLEALATGLNSAATHLLRRIRRSDRTMGISPSQASALSVLTYGGPCSLGALAAAEQVTAPSMSRTVAALEAGGLARREPDPHDRRAVVLYATPRGRRLIERGRRLRVASLVRALAGLPAPDRDALVRALEVLRRLEVGDPPWPRRPEPLAHMGE